MVEYKLYFTKQAIKDSKNLKSAGLKPKAEKILASLIIDPYRSNIYSFEKLIGDLKGLYSIRINIKHRIVFEIIESEKSIKIIRMWTHYE